MPGHISLWPIFAREFPRKVQPSLVAYEYLKSAHGGKKVEWGKVFRSTRKKARPPDELQSHDLHILIKLSLGRVFLASALAEKLNN